MENESGLYSFFVCLVFLFMLESCNSEDKNDSAYSLSGRIKGIDSGWIYVKHRQTNKIDSAKIKNGVFTVIGKSETPEFCNIGTGSMGSREFYFGFFLQAGEMKLTANKDSLFDAAVSFEGSPTQDEFKQFQKEMRSIDSLDYQIWLAGMASSSQDSLDLKAKKLGEIRKDMIWTYALKHPNSYISAFEASSYLMQEEDILKLDSIFNRMSPSLQKWFYSEKINQFLQKHKKPSKNDN